MEDLLGGERVKAEAVGLLDPAKEVFVPIDREVGVGPPLKRRICTPPRLDDLLQLLPELPRARGRIPPGVRQGDRRHPKRRLVGADVRVVDVAVDDVRDDTARVLAAQRTASAAGAEVEERALGEEALAFRGPERRAPSAAREEESIEEEAA